MFYAAAEVDFTRLEYFVNSEDVCFFENLKILVHWVMESAALRDFVRQSRHVPGGNVFYLLFQIFELTLDKMFFSN